jgi:pyruvate kinase
MRRQRSTKIVATLGPASSKPHEIRALFEAGADVFRLNFSHGTAQDHKQRAAAIRELEAELGRPIGILADMQGPKLRIGTFAGGPAVLAAGAPFRLELNQREGNAGGVTLPHPEIFAALEKDLELLLDDGRVRLQVVKYGKDFADTVVITGGTLSDR